MLEFRPCKQMKSTRTIIKFILSIGSRDTTQKDEIQAMLAVETN
jgi:hypothetical protein